MSDSAAAAECRNHAMKAEVSNRLQSNCISLCMQVQDFEAAKVCVKFLQTGWCGLLPPALPPALLSKAWTGVREGDAATAAEGAGDEVNSIAGDDAVLERPVKRRHTEGIDAALDMVVNFKPLGGK